MQAPSVMKFIRSQFDTWPPAWRVILRGAMPLIFPLLLLLLWQLIVFLNLYPSFIIPTPASVLEKSIDVIRNGTLWFHASVTLSQTLIGFVLGAVLGVALGYGIAKQPLLDALLSPLVVAFQSTPVVAYAPLLVIWFDSGATSKIVTSTLIVLFPMLMNTVVGIRNVPPPLRDLMVSMRATPWQMFSRLEVPAALPVLLGGLKVSATLAVIGSVVGEFVASNAGLGFLINLARNQYDTALVVVTVITLALIARGLYAAVGIAERRLLRWQRRGRSGLFA